MVLALAALLLHIGPAVPSLPAAAAAATGAAAKSSPAPAANPAPPTATVPAPVLATDLPEAPLPSSANAPSAPDSSPAQPVPSRTDSAGRQPILRASAVDASARDTQVLSGVHIPDSNTKLVGTISPIRTPARREWIALTIANHSAAAFDAYATRRAVQSGATEQDPFIKPFAHTDGIYAAIQICPVVLDFAARHMQHSDNLALRRTWWLPQSIGTGIFLFAGAHNMEITRH